MTKFLALEYIVAAAIVAMPVWIATESLAVVFWPKKEGTEKRRGRLILAMVLGPMMMVAAFSAGWLPHASAHTDHGHKFGEWFFAGIMGFVAAVGAKGLNDWLVNPIKKRLGKA